MITTIVGNGLNAATICLNRVLKKKKSRWLVLDYTGRLGIALQGMGRYTFQPEETTWFDLANKRHPSGAFKLQHSTNLSTILFTFFKTLRAISSFPVSDTTLQWVSEAGAELSKNGRLTLGTLLHGLTTAEMQTWHFDKCGAPHELVTVQKMLIWCLDFPSVYGFSESLPAGKQQNWLIPEKKVVWVEAFQEHFEHVEHKIMAILLSTLASVQINQQNCNKPAHQQQNTKIPVAGNKAITGSFRNIHRNSVRAASHEKLTIVHGFPPTEIRFLEKWVDSCEKQIQHTSVHQINPAKKPDPIILQWLKRASTVWVTPLHGKIDYEYHKEWLSYQECGLVNKLQPGKLLIKDTHCDKSVVAKVRGENSVPVVHQLRRQGTPKANYAHPYRLKLEGLQTTNKQKLIYDQLADKEMLRLAWQKVRQGRKESCGIDGVTIAKFGEHQERQLAKLASELRSRNYRARPLRKIHLKKPDGGKRDIRVHCIRDRVVQSACLMLLEPIFEPEFSNYSFAFSPRRNAHQALILAAGFMSDGYTWVVSADIEKYFDNVDQQLLLQMLEKKVGDEEILSLISNWLAIDVIEFKELVPILSGVAQGSSLSPFLANIFLDPLDKFLEKEGYPFLRYADDIVVFTRDEQKAERTLQAMKNFLGGTLSLRLQPSKTQCLALQEGVDFLGFTLKPDGIRIKDKKMYRISFALEDRIRILGKHRSLEGIFEHMMKLNSLVRGLRNYFSVPVFSGKLNFSQIDPQFKSLDTQTDVLGKQFLSETFLKESVWCMRERFFITDTLLDSSNGAQTQSLKQIVSSYPEQQTMQEAISDCVVGLEIPKKESIDPANKMEDNQAPFITEDNQIHFFHHGCLLTCDQEYIIVKKKKKEIWRHRLTESSALFLQGKGNVMTTKLQLALGKHDIPLFLLTMSCDVAVIQSGPIRIDKSNLRIKQAARHNDPLIIKAGLSMLAAKVGNQAALLKYFAKYRKKTKPSVADQLIQTAREIERYTVLIRELSPSIATIRRTAMGLEGKAAANYWQTSCLLFPERYNFSKRLTKGAKDVVNQCLNYCYSLLYGEVWRVVYGNGLDPCFGIMHSSQRDKGSLVFDLIEEFRTPFADRLVFSLFGRGFSPAIGKNGYLLLSSRKTILIGFMKRWRKKIKWRSKEISPEGILHFQARSIVKLFLENSTYTPFKMKW